MLPGKLPLAPHPETVRLRRTLSANADLTCPWSGVAFRSTSPAYAGSRDLLSGEGVRRYGGRWNPPGAFAAVYASLNPETALAEALAQFRRYGLPDAAAMPRVLVAVEARLSRLLDLTDRRVRRVLRFSRRRLVEEDWRKEQAAGREALTQAVGRAAFEEGIEGMLAPAAALWSATNVVVFPAALRAGSFLRVLSPAQTPPGVRGTALGARGTARSPDEFAGDHVIAGKRTTSPAEIRGDSRVVSNRKQMASDAGTAGRSGRS